MAQNYTRGFQRLVRMSEKPTPENDSITSLEFNIANRHASIVLKGFESVLKSLLRLGRGIYGGYPTFKMGNVTLYLALTAAT